MLNLTGYSQFVPPGNPKRGVIIFVLDSLDAYPVIELNDSNFDEAVFVKITVQDKSLLFGCVYRSPNSCDQNNCYLNQLLSKANNYALQNSLNLVITGDFNYKEINWHDYCSNSSSNHPSVGFIDTVLDNNFHQHVLEKTRFRGEDTPTLTDLILTNEIDTVNNLCISNPLGKSDHAVLLFNINMSVEIPLQTRNGYNFYKANYDEIRQHLLKIDWSVLFENKSTEDCWSLLKLELNDLIKKYVPLQRSKKSSFKNKPMWMNVECQKAMKTKKYAWKKYKSQQSKWSALQYIRARNNCTKTLRSSKLNLEKKIALEAKQNPKSFWNYIKSQTKQNTEIPNLQNSNGEITSNNEEKAEVLNNYFASVFKDDGNLESTPHLQPKKYEHTLDQIICYEDEVLKKLKSLKVDKSPGPDGLHPKLLFELSDVLCKPLCMLFNKSIREGVVPIDWKTARVSALHKKGDRSLPSNYRPVSLTSIVCKLLESIIRDNIESHLKSNNLLSDHQFGFREGRCCTSQLLHALDTWTTSLNNGLDTDIIFLDFAKAFDTVSHNRLLNKLNAYGITGQIKMWLSNFLTSRTQFVKVKDSASPPCNVKSGVPQGSILGPTLFLIYINDLPDGINSSTKIFADDTKVFSQVKTNEDCISIQNDLHSLFDWSQKWDLHFNASKCVHIHIGSKYTPHQYYMKEQDGSLTPIKKSDCERDLGVLINSKLTPSNHVDQCVLKASRVVGSIKRSFNYMDKEMFLSLYKTQIRPIVEYASPAWSPHLKKDKDKLEKVQRRATKLVPNLQDLPYTERLKHLGLPTLLYRRDRQDLIQVYQILNDEKHVLSHLFTKNSDTRLRA